MATEETSPRFTDDEITTFTGKLEAWGGTLPEREQQLLGAIILNALSPQGDDVRGYFWGWGGAVAQLQNAENVRSTAEKRLEQQRKDLTKNWAG